MFVLWIQYAMQGANVDMFFARFFLNFYCKVAVLCECYATFTFNIHKADISRPSHRTLLKSEQTSHRKLT